MDSCRTPPINPCLPEPLIAGRECQAKVTQAGFPPSPTPSKSSCSSGKGNKKKKNRKKLFYCH